jgi:hypothetical protein
MERLGEPRLMRQSADAVASFTEHDERRQSAQHDVGTADRAPVRSLH